MTLKELLVGVPLTSKVPDEVLALDVAGVAYDSRKVTAGSLFFAFSGAKAEGSQFANSAMAKGAVAVVSDRPKPPGFSGPWIHVAHGRQALAKVSRAFYGKPDERLALTGITGTNGKTTTTTLIDAMLRAAGKTTALIGTIEYRLGGTVLPAVNTTPESLDLFRMFSEVAALGGTHATLEASSHALDLGRIYAMHFHTAGFTNLTRDHLDYHETMESYFAAKELLFRPYGTPPPKFAILNSDDEWSRRITPAAESEVYWYGIDQDPPASSRGHIVRASHIDSSFAGLRFDVDVDGRRFPVHSSLVGRINVYNILLAAAAGLTLGLSDAEIQSGLAEMLKVAGRFERVEEGQPFLLIVDYAHTDDALRNVIAAARGLKPKRIIT
jgi:UDP-N-acetylmuramoyl-L-alanyl-D-glutamate--2,6-diaminopimelate ligase